MKKIMLAAVLALSLSVLPVRGAGAQTALTAGEAYVVPEYRDIMQMLYMMDVFPLDQDKYVTAYIRLMYCDMFKKYIFDDFVWHKLLQQTTKQLRMKGMHYRSLYQLSGAINLGQYDFESMTFPLVRDTAFNKVGTMTLFSKREFRPYCELNKQQMGAFAGSEGKGKGGGSVNEFNTLPQLVRVYLGKPFTFTHYKLPRADAEKLLERMAKSKNNARELFIRFRLRVHSVYSAESETTGPGGKTDISAVNLNGEVMSIDLFYDREMTEWIGTIPLR